MKRRRIDPGAHECAVRMAQVLPLEDRRRLQLSYRMAFERMRAGTADGDHAATLGTVANIALVLAERTGNPEVGVELVKDAQDALLRAAERKQRAHGDSPAGRYVLDGPGLQAVAKLLDLHDAQLEHHTARQFRDAIEEAARRVRAGDVLECVAP